MKDKTLVILSPGFPASENDSTCLPAQQEFLLSLKKHFSDLNILVLAFQYPFTAAHYLWNGINVISFGGRNQGKFYRLMLWQKILRQLNSLQKTHELIGVLSFWYGECAFTGKNFSLKNGLPHYCWVLGQDAKANNKYVKKTKLSGDQIVAMSDFLAAEFYKNYGIMPAHIVTNGIGSFSFDTNKVQRTIDIIGVGSLIPLKQYEIFISCIELLCKKNSELQTIICGEGPQKDYLQEMIENKGLHKNISLAGELSHPEIIQQMKQSKILLHPSSYEGFSTVCLEALAAGAQVVSFCKPMHEDIPNWHTVRDVSEMTAKLFQLLAAKPEPASVIPYQMDDSAKKMMQLFLS